MLRPFETQTGDNSAPASRGLPACGIVEEASSCTRTVAQPPRQWLGNSDAIAAVWLLGSLTCLALAACMTVGENRRVYLLGWSTPVPETCVTYSRFGVDCPGCGLTRTFVHLAHGEFESAWRLSPAGWLVFAFACLQIPFGTAQLVFRARSRWVEAWGAWNDWGAAGLMVVLVLQWLVRTGERMLT